MDLVFGLLVYVVTAWGFDRAFGLVDLLVVMFFAFGPDLDLAPYFLFRRRFGWSSHWFIHFPLLYFPIGGALVWVVTGECYYLVAFATATSLHFLHDSKAIEGVQWFWPISPAAYRLVGFRRVSEEERRCYYFKLAEGAHSRSIWDEVTIRTFRRAEWMRRR